MMDLSSLTPAQRWTHFINEELKIRQRMEWKSFNGNYPNSDELQEWVPAAGVKPTKEELQIWWGAVGNIWREYSRQNAVGINPNPPPANLASIMAVLCGYLAVGRMPEPMGDAVAEGRTQIGPTEKRDIGLAVAYHCAAKSQIFHNGQSIKIDDLTPTKTISQNFAVKPNTVRNWVRKYQPAFLGVNNIESNILIHLMKEAGVRYKRAGRSHAAISKRQKGNSPAITQLG